MKFQFPLSQIPASAGKLTLKAMLEAARGREPSARLPLAVFVREG